jgi:hypothetical protein
MTNAIKVLLQMTSVSLQPVPSLKPKAYVINNKPIFIKTTRSKQMNSFIYFILAINIF